MSKTKVRPLQLRINNVEEDSKDREARAYYDDGAFGDKKSIASSKSNNISKLVKDNLILVIAGSVLGGLIVLIAIVVLVISVARRFTRSRDDNSKTVPKLDSSQNENIAEYRQVRKLKSQFVPGTKISEREQKALSLILNQYK